MLPAYGLTCPGLGDAGVHLRERDGWRRLEHDEVARHAKVVPSVLDLRYA